ncbi:PREDICTED: uncharacterized protein LOC109242303 [Nicotiana attenuata]|uniref:uncharacterized protein LOC109242303 n=1 Tax=Nicotiana attenuata TaxID=49451 RepID=UPI000905583F|nr:PREDICTED: uncharacterized protein LOC109242303 [Nicotiana attenuata]
MDIGYSGNPFTWCKGWASARRIWARLDRVLINFEWLQRFLDTSATHLVRTGSDHAPLLISTSNPHREPKKYFRFLDFWTEQEGFMKVVKQAWQLQTKELQNMLETLEERCLNDNSESNRMMYNSVNAQLIRNIKNKESFWGQKAGLKWFIDDDNNTRFFHSVINSKRKKLQLTKVKKQDGTWLENRDDIVAGVVSFF